MRFSTLSLLSVLVLSPGLDMAHAQNVSEGEDVSIRLKGNPTVYIQKTKVDVVELRGDRKDPDFVERSWASAQVRDQESLQDRGPEKLQLGSQNKSPESSSAKATNKTPVRGKKPAMKKERALVAAESKRAMKRAKSVTASKKQSNATSSGAAGAGAGLGPALKVSKATDVKGGARLKD